MRKLRRSEVILKFPDRSTLDKRKFLCFSAASFPNLKKGSSLGGFTVSLCGNNKYAPIAWKSKNLKQGLKSTVSAETLALKEALESCFMIKSVL